MRHNISLFTPVALLVFFIFIVIAFLVGSHIDRQRLKAKEDNYPKAKKIKLPKKIDSSLDEFENYIS